MSLTTPPMSEFTNVLIIIDTAYLKGNFPNPSKDPTHPMVIEHDSQYMICSAPHDGVTGQGSADIGFNVLAGDGQSQELFGYFSWDPSFKTQQPE
jgi:hypothetical protein